MNLDRQWDLPFRPASDQLFVTDALELSGGCIAMEIWWMLWGCSLHTQSLPTSGIVFGVRAFFNKGSQIM